MLEAMELTKRLTLVSRRVLLDHIDGAEIALPIARDQSWPTRELLIRLGLVRFGQNGTDRPRTTKITEKGREVLACLLAEYADALLRAGYGIERRAAVLDDALLRKLTAIEVVAAS